MSRDKSAPGLARELTQAYRQDGERLRAITGRAGREDAADLAQEAFLKVVEVGGRAEVKAPVHLLFRIARNAVIDKLRGRRRAAALFTDEAGAEHPDPGASPERILIASERLRRALAIIEAMPPKRREVFLAHRIDALSYPQIAKRCGVSIKTVEKHMSAAMDQLSREMDEDDAG